ncbi:MAG: antitoxin HicB [Propionibacteriaceae bacterium]|jgi:hypothetical protein|nr:antitoxin HicB [Propionibacteriaceae bacterium]
MNTVKVTATRWRGGWELVLPDGGATQCRTLAGAIEQVRDYLDTVQPDIDHGAWEIDVMPNLGTTLNDVRAARDASETAQIATITAAKQLRRAVKGLRAQGLSLADTATVLGVSKTRAQQLVAA